MLVTPKFVFIHLPKTAGRFCRHQIVEHAGPVLYRGGLHGPVTRLPAEYRGLPIIAFVRNPWDWYVSWYFHMLEYGGFNPLFAAAVRVGKKDFSEIMHHVFDSMEDGTSAAQQLDEYLKTPDYIRQQSHDLDTSMILFQRSRDCGVLGWRYLFNLGEDESVIKYIGRFENLVEDLIVNLSKCGAFLDAEAAERIRMARPVGEGGVRKKRDYREFYEDQSLIERVAHKERVIIDKFDYTFG